MENNDRLTGIEARAKALGWTCETYCDDTDNMNTGAPFCYTIKFYTPTRWLVLEGPMAIEAAERLLALYEPGATMTVERFPDGTPCIGFPNRGYEKLQDGTFKLIPVEVPDAAV